MTPRRSDGTSPFSFGPGFPTARPPALCDSRDRTRGRPVENAPCPGVASLGARAGAPCASSSYTPVPDAPKATGSASGCPLRQNIALFNAGVGALAAVGRGLKNARRRLARRLSFRCFQLHHQFPHKPGFDTLDGLQVADRYRRAAALAQYRQLACVADDSAVLRDVAVLFGTVRLVLRQLLDHVVGAQHRRVRTGGVLVWTSVGFLEVGGGRLVPLYDPGGTTSSSASRRASQASQPSRHMDFVVADWCISFGNIAQPARTAAASKHGPTLGGPRSARFRIALSIDLPPPDRSMCVSNRRCHQRRAIDLDSNKAEAHRRRDTST